MPPLCLLLLCLLLELLLLELEQELELLLLLPLLELPWRQLVLLCLLPWSGFYVAPPCCQPSVLTALGGFNTGACITSSCPMSAGCEEQPDEVLAGLAADNRAMDAATSCHLPPLLDHGVRSKLALPPLASHTGLPQT